MTPPPSTPLLDRPVDLASSTALDDSFGRSAIHDPTAATASEAEGGRTEPRREGPAAHWADLDWPTVVWIGGVHLAALAIVGGTAEPQSDKARFNDVCCPGCFLCFVVACVRACAQHHDLTPHTHTLLPAGDVRFNARVLGARTFARR